MTLSSKTLSAQYDFAKIPAEVKGLVAFVLWRLEEKGPGQKPSKVPYVVSAGLRGVLERAKTDTPSSWGRFEDACRAYANHPDLFNGVGLVISPHFGIWGIDFDPLDKRRSITEFPEAVSLMSAAGSYAEESVSGSGFHTISRIGEGQRLPFLEDRKSISRHGFRVEPFRQGFFVLTGRHLPGTPDRLCVSTEALAIVESLVKERREAACPVAHPARATALTLGDRDILERMYKASSKGSRLRSLYLGDPLDYDSLSERDFALIDELGYSVDWDLDAVARLARSSGCVRQKWNSPRGGKTWLRASIEKAYSGRRSNGASANRAATGAVSSSLSPASKPPAKTLAVKFYLDDEVDQFGPPVWHFEDHFECGALVVVVASSGTGKSLLVSHWAWSVSQGLPIFGKAVRQSKVIYLMSEGGRGGYKLRRDAWKFHHGVSKITDFAVCLDSFDLSDVKGGEKLAAKVNAVFAEPPGLIVVDTMSCNAGGIDLDKNQDVLTFLGQVNVLRRLTGATVLLVTHTGWTATRREFGAKSLRNSADTTVLLEREQGSSRLKVGFLKQRNAALGEPYELECFPVLGSICLRQPNSASPLPPPPPRIDDPLEPTFLAVLWEEFRAGRPTHQSAIRSEVEDAIQQSSGHRPRIHPRDVGRVFTLLDGKGLVRASTEDDTGVPRRGRAKPYIPLKVFRDGAFYAPSECGS
jgi:hypothetical protein